MTMEGRREGHSPFGRTHEKRDKGRDKIWESGAFVLAEATARENARPAAGFIECAKLSRVSEINGVEKGENRIACALLFFLSYDTP